MSEDDVVEGLAEAIDARRITLGLSPSQFVKATGLSQPGLAPLRAGLRRDYQDRLKFAVCDALGWTRDSIDRLLRGEPPVLLGDPVIEALEADPTIPADAAQEIRTIVERVRRTGR